MKIDHFPTADDVKQLFKESKPLWDKIDSIETPSFEDISIQENKKKTIEVNRIKLFIAAYDDDIKILEIQESPDFMLEQNQVKIGAELVSIVKHDSSVGNIPKLFELANEKLKEELPHYKALLNCYIEEGLTTTQRSIKIQAAELSEIIKEKIETGILRSNKYVSEININSHSILSIYPNYGAGYCFGVTLEDVNNNILKKEKKYNTYTQCDADQIWLLMYISGENKDGCITFPDNIEEFSTVTDNSFDKIFMFDGFGRCCCLK